MAPNAQTSVSFFDPRAAGGKAREATFYIAATEPTTRPRRTLKYGDSFVVVDSHGDIGASAGGPDGLFNYDMRYLSRLELLVG